MKGVILKFIYADKMQRSVKVWFFHFNNSLNNPFSK